MIQATSTPRQCRNYWHTSTHPGAPGATAFPMNTELRRGYKMTHSTCPVFLKKTGAIFVFLPILTDK